MFELVECSLMIIQLLEKLKNEGKITQEEYESHVKVKREFLLHCQKLSSCEKSKISSDLSDALLQTNKVYSS